MAGLRFRSMSDHVEDIASGLTVEPGGFVELSENEANDPHNKRLIEEGFFVEVEAAAPAKNQAKALQQKEGGSN